MNSRWYEVPKIVDWTVNKLMRIHNTNLNPKIKRKMIKCLNTLSYKDCEKSYNINY